MQRRLMSSSGSEKGVNQRNDQHCYTNIESFNNEENEKIPSLQDEDSTQN